jgi:hypothetical protein
MTAAAIATMATVEAAIGIRNSYPGWHTQNVRLS